MAKLKTLTEKDWNKLFARIRALEAKVIRGGKMTVSERSKKRDTHFKDGAAVVKKLAETVDLDGKVHKGWIQKLNQEDLIGAQGSIVWSDWDDLTVGMGVKGGECYVIDLADFVGVHARHVGFYNDKPLFVHGGDTSTKQVIEKAIANTLILPGGSGSFRILRTGLDVIALYDHAHGNEVISQDKAVFLGWLSEERRWQVIGAECEDAP